MELHSKAEGLGQLDELDHYAKPLAATVKQYIGAGTLKDLLSGTGTGHPAHPMLTDVPIGLLTSATVLDLLAGKRGEQAARRLVGLGIISMVPTAAAGAADWSDTIGSERRIGFVHALANSAALGFYTMSYLARRRGRRGFGALLALVGAGSMAAGGYLGGHLVYSRGIGVNHAFMQSPPGEWTSVMADAALVEGTRERVDADGAEVLLVRAGQRVHAIGSICSHAGGPLEDGQVDPVRCTVTCPWHDSVFRLEDGVPVHGPASVPQVAYDVRVDDGQIQVRRRG